MNALVDIPGTVAKCFKFENLKGLTNPQLRYLQSGAAREPQETAMRCGESANQAVGLRRTERSNERFDTTEIDVPKPLKTQTTCAELDLLSNSTLRNGSVLCPHERVSTKWKKNTLVSYPQK